MWIRQEKLTIVFLVLLVAAFVLIFGYEVYVYATHTGKAYQRLFAPSKEGELR